ncbi:MAG: hypothetical protein ACD_43C00269G0001, partial [uncultured bacterium]
MIFFATLPITTSKKFYVDIVIGQWVRSDVGT